MTTKDEAARRAQMQQQRAAERAIWDRVERIGQKAMAQRAAAATQAPRTTMTKADQDQARAKQTQ